MQYDFLLYWFRGIIISMFSWRARRQLAVVAVFAAALFGVFVLLVPKALPVASCTDGKRNQEERGIDCGGPCVSCALRNAEEISLFWTRVTRIAQDTYGVAAFIENPNANLYSENVQYEFSLFDELGQIARRTGSTFVLPAETLHVIETNLSTTRKPTRVSFRIANLDWIFTGEGFIPPDIIVEEHEYQIRSDETGVKSAVEAQIFNRSSEGFGELEVGFVALNRDGNVLGVNRVVIERLEPGEHRSLISLWPHEFSDEVDHVIVEPRVNTLDESVIFHIP